MLEVRTLWVPPTTRVWLRCCWDDFFLYQLLTDSCISPCIFCLQDAFTLGGEPYGRHQLLKFGSGAPVILAVGTGLAIPGYTLIVDDRSAADLFAAVINKVRFGHNFISATATELQILVIIFGVYSVTDLEWWHGSRVMHVTNHWSWLW